MALSILKSTNGLSERDLRMADKGDVDAVLKECKERRAMHRESNKGYSNNKGKTMRDLGKIPASIYWNPAFDHIFHDPTMDLHEKQKHLRAFFKKFPSFLCVDKM